MCFTQGALIGSVCGMLLVTWISVGRMAMNITYPSLPLTSVDQCPAAVANDTLLWQQSNVTADWTSVSSVTHSYYVTQVDLCIDCWRFCLTFLALLTQAISSVQVSILTLLDLWVTFDTVDHSAAYIVCPWRRR